MADNCILIAGWRDPGQMAVNLAMLRNLLDGLEPTARAGEPRYCMDMETERYEAS